MSNYWEKMTIQCYTFFKFKKETKIVFQKRLSLNAGQKYCRMLQGEHSAILSTFIKLPFVIKIFVLSIFEWLLKTGFTVHVSLNLCNDNGQTLFFDFINVCQVTRKMLKTEGTAFDFNISLVT